MRSTSSARVTGRRFTRTLVAALAGTLPPQPRRRAWLASVARRSFERPVPMVVKVTATTTARIVKAISKRIE